MQNSRGFPTFDEMLPPEQGRILREKVRDLSRLNSFLSLAAILGDWFVVLLTIWLASQNGIWIQILALVIIGSRQHALLLMMHEGAHFRLSQNQKLNDFLSDVFCSYPFFMKMNEYRLSHLAHHQHLNTNQDPNWVATQVQKDWRFPKSKIEIIRILAGQLFGANLWPILKKFFKFDFFKTPGPFIYWGLVFFVLTHFQLWPIFLFYWMLPLFTVLSFLLRVRALAEHSGLKLQSELSQSRNVKTNMVGELFLSPHNGNWHLDHHLFPSVPFFNLKKLHQALLEIESYEAMSTQTKSYLGIAKGSLIDELSKNKS